MTSPGHNSTRDLVSHPNDQDQLPGWLQWRRRSETCNAGPVNCIRRFGGLIYDVPSVYYLSSRRRYRRPNASRMARPVASWSAPYCGFLPIAQIQPLSGLSVIRTSEYPADEKSSRCSSAVRITIFVNSATL